MTFFMFLGALSASLFVFELGNMLTGAVSAQANRLSGVQTNQTPSRRYRSTVNALILALLPSRFDERKAKNLDSVVDLLRRAGYPYGTPGEFYAAAMRTFSTYLAIGGVLGGAMFAFDMGGLAAGGVLLVFIFLGLRRPYSSLKKIVKKRAETMRSNMLIGLSMLESLLASGVGVQDAIRRTATVGGTFCNLMGLLVARMEVDDFSVAIGTIKKHLPDPKDTEAMLFLRDVEDFFTTNRPLLTSVKALRESIHRSVVEETESRAALVRSRAGMFGIFSIVGLIITIVLPAFLAFG